MGEKHLFQPLTIGDRISVMLYRTGIVMSAIVIAIISYMVFNSSHYQKDQTIILKSDIMLISLYISVGLSVSFIHLYVSRFHRALKNLYFISIASLIILFIVGEGDILGVLVNKPYGPLLLIPLAGCLGFITAKEAFCFKLTEGYLIAIIMPLYLLLLSAGGMSMKGVVYGLLLIAVMFVFFTFRKVFMPIHYDIGDKSAYS